tara:strand:+ start:7655 stop:10099 length:2445 start_codon:yes stop_codon:yes gene_type:complete
MKIRFAFLFLFFQTLLAAQTGTIEGKITYQTSEGLILAHVFIPKLNKGTTTNEEGYFQLREIPFGKYHVQISYVGMEPVDTLVKVKSETITLNIDMVSTVQLGIDIIYENDRNNISGYDRLKSVEGTAIYASKKNEIIKVADLTANLSSNNARQVFARVPGVNVWESDVAGLQLGVGARGLSPDRTANFNTRQNGYDMAADALGYPESYYAPPMQAIERVEIVRGAASLQYGTQFGGMINLQLKKGPTNKRLASKTMNTYNSVGYFNTYNELGGQSGKLNYYSFWNYRKGSGFRDYTDFYANTNYLRLGYEFNNRFRMAVDYTYMSYLAQQPGGLTDVQYQEDPYQSLRTRNWFKVRWNLASITLDYDISDRTLLNSRFFGLMGTRQAVGNLQTPNRPDLEPYNNRDLLVDYYRNVGNETRFLHRYHIRKQPAAFLIGARFYRGFTEKTQGFGSTGTDADFRFYTEDLKLKSDYDFPSYNLAIFSENIFNITDRLSVTPGIRMDRIVTTADGYYDSSIRIPLTGEVVVDSSTFENRKRERNLLLLGIGLSYKFNDHLELYSNFSQNYRAITFNDIRVVNPSAAVDPQLQDEKGFNLDLGVRGEPFKGLTTDIGVFLLSYEDRIGSYLRIVEDEFFGQRLVRYTTNIADARIAGLESYLEADINTLLHLKGRWRWSIFTNLAYTYAQYYNAEESAIEDNRVEYVPEWNFKTGLQSRWKKLGMALQFSYVSDQFSEATNAGADGSAGSPTGIFGLIPSYTVLDFSADYTFKGFLFEAGVNNITNQVYFTRRATGYPGPGIITASPLNFYLGLGYSL